MGTTENKQRKIIRDFIAAIKKNPAKGLSQIGSVREQMADAEYGADRSFIESLCDGPHEGIVYPVYNAVGSIYQKLSRKHKDLALNGILGIMDRIKYNVIQSVHTPYIDDALLHADIDIARGHLYWPGIFDGHESILCDKERGKDFDKIKNYVLTKTGLIKSGVACSDFVLTYGLLRSDYWSHNEEFAKALNPKVLDYAVRGIVWMRFGRAENDEDIAKGTKRLEELLPQCVQDKIEPMRLEAGWVTDPEIIHK